MSRPIKIITLISGLIALSIGIYAWIEFNRGHTSLNEAAADFTLTAAELYAAYDMNEVDADQQYAGKIIELEGTVDRIENPTESIVNVLLNAGDDKMGGVLCSFENLQAKHLDRVEEGVKIKLRGKCAGFLMDVSLQRCVIIN